MAWLKVSGLGEETPYMPTMCRGKLSNCSFTCITRPFAKKALTVFRWQARDWCIRMIVPPGRVSTPQSKPSMYSILDTSAEVGPYTGCISGSVALRYELIVPIPLVVTCASVATMTSTILFLMRAVAGSSLLSGILFPLLPSGIIFPVTFTPITTISFSAFMRTSLSPSHWKVALTSAAEVPDVPSAGGGGIGAASLVMKVM